MSKVWKLVAAGFVFIFFTGCTIRIVDFTAISTKNVKLPTKAKGKRVTGEDCVPVFLFPLGVPNMKEAIDEAIESAGENYDALVDGVVYHINQSFLVGRMCYKVEGTPINTKDSVSMNEIEGKNLMLHSYRSQSFSVSGS
jgi:hypothetical protein